MEEFKACTCIHWTMKLSLKSINVDKTENEQFCDRIVYIVCLQRSMKMLFAVFFFSFNLFISLKLLVLRYTFL